jgi:steroid delta-isomerase
MTPVAHENAVRSYYELVDKGDTSGLVALFGPNAVYRRPGYPPLCGRDDIKRFYQDQRVIRVGRHSLETIVASGSDVAVHGLFQGILHTGEQVDARFADFFAFNADGTVARRDTFFFAPLI